MIPIDLIEQGLWGLGQETERLEEMRSDLAPLWADSAAREINSRCLDPRQDEATRMTTSIREMIEHLKQLQQRLGEARDFAVAVGRANAASDEALTKCGVEMRDSGRLEGVSLGLQWTVEKVLIRQIEEELRQANSYGSQK